MHMQLDPLHIVD